MRALLVIHRWLGVVFCLFFAMWFATGIVMHFVPFPALTEAERIAGLRAIEARDVQYPADKALTAAGMRSALRVRLIARPDGAVYVIEGANGVVAIRATDLGAGAVESPELALSIAMDHARNRGLEGRTATVVDLASHDQWTVPNSLDVHRPLYRVALDDGAGTELYVSSRTGEVVRDTTRTERAWNYAGSVTHWIYPTALRRRWAAWDVTVWTLALAATIAAMTGAVLGVCRLRIRSGRLLTPFAGWHAWHHGLGIGAMIFVLTWIVSGWLSMDHGRLFSTGQANPGEISAFTGRAMSGLTLGAMHAPTRGAREIEWFVFDGRVHRRERFELASQRMAAAEGAAPPYEGYVSREAVTGVSERLRRACTAAQRVEAADPYRFESSMPGAPVYRVICGDVWFHVDAADGRVLEKLDPSRRAYRWLYSALHTLDVPSLVSHPWLRTTIIVMLCTLGLGFSITAVVIGWRRVTK